MTRFALFAPLLVSACTAPAMKPPSLLPRAIEAIRIDDAPVSAAAGAPAAVSAETTAAIVRLLAQADAGEQAQLKVLAANRRELAGRRAAEGSEAWIAAQTALSALEAARIPTLDAASELDRLDLAAEATADQAALAAAKVRVQAILDREDARAR